MGDSVRLFPMLTKSEALFQQLCDALGIPVERIHPSRAGGERSPDYRIRLGYHEVFTEVKQFDPNPEEQAAAAAIAAGEIQFVGTTPGKKVRRAIDRAAPQLKALSGGSTPTMLVVFNNTVTRFHTDPYAIATAMRGLDVIPVQVFREGSAPPEFGQPRSGPGRKMTETDNTTISAVAVLLLGLDESPRLAVFHNEHARNPIDPAWLRNEHVTHWTLRPDAESSLVDAWLPA